MCESREWVLQPLTEAVFQDDDFMSEAWQRQRQIDDEIHPVSVYSQSHPWES